MRAARLHAPRDLRVEEVRRPEPGSGWVLVRTEAVGICGTDKAFYRGSYPLLKVPLTLGHEAVGVVVEGPEELVGKRVVTEINLVLDWSEPLVREGMYTHALRRLVLGITFDGAMADYFLTRVEAVHVVEGLEPEKAVFVEPLAAVLRALRLEPPRPGWAVAVLGTGALAYLAAQVLRLHGCRVIVVARRDSPKRRFFEEQGFKTMTFEEALEWAKENTWAGTGFDAVFEATGSPEGLEQAVELARPLGVVYLKSTHGMPVAFNQTQAVVKELKIVCSRCGTSRDFREAISLLEEGKVKTRVTAVYTLDQAVEAMEKSLERDQLKVVVKP